MRLNLLDIEYEIEILDLKDNNISIELHDDLVRYGRYDYGNIFCITHPPIFLKAGHKYFLVARHLAYACYVSAGVFKFPALVFNDESLLNQIFEIDRTEFDMFSSSLGFLPREINERPRSRKTLTKYKAIASGRICPFCNGPLRGPQNKKPFEKGKYRITCENKSNRNIANGQCCDFYAILTENEFELFKKYKLPTSKWLQKIDDRKCPKCGSEVFLRVGPKPGSDEIISFKRCRNYNNSSAKKCIYNEPYQK